MVWLLILLGSAPICSALLLPCFCFAFALHLLCFGTAFTLHLLYICFAFALQISWSWEFRWLRKMYSNTQTTFMFYKYRDKYRVDSLNVTIWMSYLTAARMPGSRVRMPNPMLMQMYDNGNQFTQFQAQAGRYPLTLCTNYLTPSWIKVPFFLFRVWRLLWSFFSVIHINWWERKKWQKKYHTQKTSTTQSCRGPIPAQKSRGNSVPGVVFSHTMPKMDSRYSHRFSW